MLRIAREQGIIPWGWIVDEGRDLKRVPTSDDPADYARSAAQSYRRDYWNQQPVRVRCGPRKAPCAACSPPCSITMPSVFFRCMGSAAPPLPMMLPRITTDGRVRPLRRRL